MPFGYGRDAAVSIRPRNAACPAGECFLTPFLREVW